MEQCHLNISCNVSGMRFAFHCCLAHRETVVQSFIRSYDLLHFCQRQWKKIQQGVPWLDTKHSLKNQFQGFAKAQHSVLEAADVSKVPKHGHLASLLLPGAVSPCMSLLWGYSLPLLPKDFKQSLILLEQEYFLTFCQLICSLWPDVIPAIILRSLHHCMIASSKQTEILFVIKSSCQKQVCKPKCNTAASNRHHKNSEQANSVAKSKYPYLSKTTKKLPKPDLL